MSYLKPVIKAAWLAALRGGEFPQGKHHLKKTLPDGVIRYCCMGVLGELAVRQGVQCPVTSEPAQYAPDGILHKFNSESCYLPRSIWDWALADEKLEIPRFSQSYRQSPPCTLPLYHVLSGFNDSDELDFHKIADWIEENL